MSPSHTSILFNISHPQIDTPPMSEHVDPQLQVAATEHVANDAASNAPLTSPEAVIAQLKLLLEQPDNADRNALDACRSAYYRLHNEAVAKAREQFLAEGGEEADFVAPEQPLEAEYKQLLANIKVRRAEMAEKAEAERQANLARKLAIIEQIKGFAADAEQIDKNYDTFKALQAEWKTVGYAPRKANQQIFDRFRAACDLFFTAKSKFYKEVRETLAANLAKKTALCEKAEQLSESTDWAATTKALVELQAEWKTIGAVAHKASDAIWKRFNTACNAFFDRKKAANASGNEEEVVNLAKKQDIIARLEQLIAEGSEKLHDAVKALQAEWNEVGHVPFKKKEKVYRAYRKACDTLYATLHEQAGRRRIDNLTRRVAAQGGNERQRLQRAYDEKKAEIATYETNLSFLTTKSKSGSSFVADVERRIELLKKDLTLLAEKIAQLGE